MNKIDKIEEVTDSAVLYEHGNVHVMWDKFHITLF